MIASQGKDFDEGLGYKFRNPSLLHQALTHPSLRQSPRPSPYERLEFLGDRVLGLCIANLLYEEFPVEEEGVLARRLAYLCGRDVLEKVGRSWGLEQAIQTASNEKITANIIADSCEALLGAIYLDGGLEVALHIITASWQPFFGQAYHMDGKTALQQWSQAHGYSLPVYTVLRKNGPDHIPVFLVEARVGNVYTTAEGPSRKAAEQLAASLLLRQLNA